MITGSEVESSIVLRGSRIAHAGRLEGPLIGRGVQATSADRAPRTHRVVQSDRSRVRLAR